MPVSHFTRPQTPRGDPQWGEILQLPNLRTQFDVAGRERDAWMARNGEMTSAQQTAMDQLSAALKAERDAKMAELLKQNQGHGGGGGGGGRGGGGGGGASPITLPSYVQPSTPWNYSPSTAPAPSLDMHLYPSEVYGPARVYHPKHALAGQKGYIPPKPKPAKPSIYNVRLS